MKELTKNQVIELASAINIDGVDNSRCAISGIITERNSQDLFGGDDGVILKPGIYCTIWADELDCSDIPNVSKFIDTQLCEDNFELIFNGDDGCILIICLEL